jgi:hypothetical protein
VEMSPHSREVVKAPLNLVCVGLELLHTHTIGCYRFGPPLKAFGRCGTNAIKVERDESKHRFLP